MRVYRRGKYWWATWTELGATVRRSTRCTSKEAARSVADRWEREHADPRHAAAHAATLAVAAREFLSDVERTNAAGTLNMYRCKVGHLNRLLPPLLRDIDVAAVDLYCERRRAEGSSLSNLYKEWVALRGVLRGAARRGHWVGDLAVLKPSWVTADYQPRKRHLSWHELDLLLVHLPVERAVLVAFVVATGARRAEWQRARAGDIRDGLITLRGSKTERSARTIPIPPVFADLALAASVWLDAHGSFTPWGNARRDLSRALARLWMAPATWNDLRRTFGSLLVQAGVAHDVVAPLMGHASTAMVSRVYGQQTAASLAALLSVPTVYQRPPK